MKYYGKICLPCVSLANNNNKPAIYALPVIYVKVISKLQTVSTLYTSLHSQPIIMI